MTKTRSKQTSATQNAVASFKSVHKKVTHIIAKLGWVRIGIIGVMITFAATAGYYAISTPWSGAADSKMHLDYIWQVSRADLPNFHEGPVYPVVVKAGMKVQYVAQHPPLFYLLFAPFMKILLAEGAWQQAVAVGRSINIVIGLGCLVAFAWGGWVFGGPRRKEMAIAVPALAMLAYPVVKVSGDIYNDTLLILTSTLAMILVYLLLKSGPSSRLLVSLCAVSVIGMSSRAAYISTLGTSLLGLIIASYLHGSGSKFKRLLRGGLWAGLIFAVVALTIGWFYFRNYQASGSWARAADQSWVNRPYKSVASIVTGHDLWVVVSARLLGLKTWAQLSGANAYISLLISAAAIIGAVYAIWRDKLLQRLRKNPAVSWMFGLFALNCLLVLGQQITHANPYGLINPRYFFPAWLPIFLVFSYGLLAWRRARGQAITIVMAILASSTVLNAMYVVNTGRFTDAGNNWDRNVRVITQLNNVPIIVMIFLLTAMIVGIALTGFSLWKVSSSKLRRT